MALLTNVMGSGTLCVLLLICSSLYAAEATTTASTPTQTNPTTPTPEKQYNEPCDPSVTNECAQGFECLNSTSEDLCECPSHQYYNESLCEERKQHKETCDSNTPNECAQGFECLSLSNPPGFLCECPSHQYYKESLCVEKLQFNETCRPDGECAENLQCDNETGTCFCLPSLYYNGSSCVESKCQLFSQSFRETRAYSSLGPLLLPCVNIGTATAFLNPYPYIKLLYRCPLLVKTRDLSLLLSKKSCKFA
ncbi:multiple epidermal growth factor-like domains protein 10 isoform X2 [Aplysia californica]|uniref:Multiple epidermal growth factor-like domains protein 10 isoform X2 n=1 Tax=Aplysia californica TaxID=6500 RepID=A0ABM1A2K7_APLCA|nr:multiple epidermal growth factor-like domains protein 10 isoform X2 [Aplysia californica]